MNNKRAQEAMMNVWGLSEDQKVLLRRELKQQRKTRIKQKKPILNPTL